MAIIKMYGNGFIKSEPANILYKYEGMIYCYKKGRHDVINFIFCRRVGFYTL